MPGNITTFNDLDIIRCFLLLNKNRSRSFLKKELELGEGSIRGILDRLKDKNLIISTRKGHILSEKGNQIFSNINKRFKFPIDFKSKEFMVKYFPIYKGLVGCACFLYDYSKNINDQKIKHIYIYRDFAIKAGADGALMLWYENKKLSFIGSDYNGDIDTIKSIIELEKDCILIITVGKNKNLAQKGIVNILLHMTNFLRI